MKVIFAQGNPDPKYKGTRHNVGFFVLDAFATPLQGTFASKPKFQAEIAEVTVQNEKVLLVKPVTYYNETGQSARQIIDFYKLDPIQDLLVIHDDLALPLGTLRTRLSGSDAGNNGIKSLTSHIGPEYARLRIGISNELQRRIADADFVLAGFTKAENDLLTDKIAPKAIELVESFIQESYPTTSCNLVPLDTEQKDQITDEHNAGQ